MEDSGQEKEFAATEHRLDEALRKGEVPVGRDLLAASAFGGLALAALALPDGLITAGDALMVLLDQSDSLAPLMATGRPAPLGALGLALATGLLAYFVLPMLAVLAVLVAQRALVFAPTRLEPKLSRLSPLQGARNKFGRNGLFEFGKGVTKLGIIATVLGLFLAQRVDGLLAGMALGPAQIAAQLGRVLVEFLLLILLVQAGMGAVDLVWQKAEHQRKHRMTRKEMTDEMKQSEGDPHIKAQRRQKAVEIASNRMIADVATADVVIVNPTHYAVALKWNRRARGAPVCVAKGVDEVAARIRAAAAEAGVPLHRDPVTARALYTSVAIGKEVRPDHYRPVAAAIRFAEAMRRKARGRSGRGPRP